MATAPKINLRDGSGSAQSVVLTTNLEFIVITGIVDTNTTDLQISINGGPFVSDPTLVAIEGTVFTVPNLASYPDGLSLELGENVILLRTIDIVGGVSATSSVTITRVAKIEEEDPALIPSGVKVNRRRDTIDILAAKPQPFVPTGQGSDVSTAEFRGFNFYASTSPGGTTGYFKINDKPVTTASTVVEEDVADVDSNRVDFNPDGYAVHVKVTMEDTFGKELRLVSDNLTVVSEFSSNLRFTGNLQNFTRTEYVFFRHNRNGGIGQINADQFVNVSSTDPLYYVVAGVYYDTANNTEFETPYSQEVLGSPLIIDTSIKDLPGRTQLQVVLDFVSAIQNVNTEISLIPGSTTRDVSIDPFSSESERIWFLVDFVHRSQSFLTLLQIDDANNDGVSDPVVSSAYKQALKAALGLQTDTAVQQLIDSQFDKLAGNFQKTRLPGRPAVGQAVFYTTVKPTQDQTIASGTIVSTDADPDNNLPAVRFIVGGTYLFPAADADAFFNFDTRRYEIITDIVAESLGSDGNRSAGSIKNIASSLSGFQVTNTEATVFGSDRESNNDLATRAELGFVSVDTGTEGGYASTSAEQTGIIKTKIVKSGDALMMRDYDDIRKKHAGGKVDIWVQGLRERTTTERFAFTFQVANDIRCQIIDLPNLRFRVIDPRVTTDTPIVELLDNPSIGLGVRNVTKGEDYDLTGATLIDYNTFQLNTGIAQPVTGIDDLITADFRYRSVNQFTFSLQPVRRVVSVVGEASGALNNTQGYSLYKTDDPLLEGESTIAKNYLVIHQVGGIPTGATITVNGETHVMIGFFPEKLASIGINTTTIRVFSEDGLIEYVSPGDFSIIQGTATTPATVIRSSSSTIVSGQTVSIDYVHDENFTVTYVINDLLQQLQRTVNRRRHATADVLVKQSILNSVDLDTTVQLKNGATKTKVDPAVRSSVSRELNQKLIGQGSAQSDIIHAVDATDGVDYEVLPLARMGYADGSRKLRETVLSTSQRLPSLDIGGNRVFILSNALNFPTTNEGGLATEHRGVFQDDETLVMATDLSIVGQYPGQAFIIGADGAIITGYTGATANHVVVSLTGAGSPQDEPDNHSYAVSYVVRNDRGPHDMTASQVEALDLGNFTITFREATTT
jgi:hypothetical protein